jgi:hypothetical protein
VEYAKLKAAVDKSPSFADYQVCSDCFVMDVTRCRFVPQSLNLAWVPRADGIFLKDDPQKLAQLGLVAKVPVVSGMFLFPDIFYFKINCSCLQVVWMMKELSLLFLLET